MIDVVTLKRFLRIESDYDDATLSLCLDTATQWALTRINREERPEDNEGGLIFDTLVMQFAADMYLNPVAQTTDRLEENKIFDTLINCLKIYSIPDETLP